MPTTTAGEPLLDGLTVLDFTRVLAGPYCTRLLADLGARVIKIERPGEGDEIRYSVTQLEPGRTDQSSYFVRLNAGKQGIAIDLAHPQARDVVLDLVRLADVVVENFSPGIMARYGLDDATLRAVRPDLVYCSISGFGQTGPLGSMQAYAHLINAISGMMDMERSGEDQPRASYLQTADVLAGTHAFGAICAALLRRARSGQGAYLDVSMLECLIAADDITFHALLNGGEVWRAPRVGMLVHSIGGRHVAMQAVGAPHLLSRLLALIGRPELATDAALCDARRAAPKLAGVCTDPPRLAGRLRECRASGSDAVRRAHPERADAVSRGDRSHPQIVHRSVFPEVAHPTRGSVRITAPPFHIDRRPIGPVAPAPYRVGENTRQVLIDVLGYSTERVEVLEREHVIESAG